jgi:hypothetical protein
MVRVLPGFLIGLDWTPLRIAAERNRLNTRLAIPRVADNTPQPELAVAAAERAVPARCRPFPHTHQMSANKADVRRFPNLF